MDRVEGMAARAFEEEVGVPAYRSSPPKLSAIVLAFNQKDFIVAAVQSLLRQSTPVQIVVCDDGSTDGTGKLAREALDRAGWPNDSVLIENDRNRGVNASFHIAFSRAAGEIIIINDGDDISTQDRAAKVLEVLALYGAPMMASGVEPISEEGEATGTPCFWSVEGDRIVEIGDVDGYGRWTVLGASMAFHRSVVEKFGPLPQGVTMCDKALTNRALALGGVVLIKERLVQYRIRSKGVTTWLTSWSVRRDVLRKKLTEFLVNSEGLRRDLGRVRAEAAKEVQEKLGNIEENLETEERMLRAVLTFPSGNSSSYLLAQLWSRDQYWRQYARRCLLMAIDPPRHEMWLRLSVKEISARVAGKLRRRHSIGR